MISMRDMVELLRSTNREYKVQVGEPPEQLQLKLIQTGACFYKKIKIINPTLVG